MAGALPLKELEEADGHADGASFSESGDLETNGLRRNAA
jgi:hypothetical protein